MVHTDLDANQLKKILQKLGIFNKRGFPKQEYVDSGHFDFRPGSLGEIWVNPEFVPQLRKQVSEYLEDNPIE